MNRRYFFALSIPAIAVAKDHGGKHRHRYRYFRDDDAVYLREYYGGGGLPPGLRKKYCRMGRLPPGWERRFRPFPVDVNRRLPPVPEYCERGYVDGYAVLYDRRTRILLDVLDIVDIASGR